MSKPLIHLTGDWKDSHIIVYTHHKYFTNPTTVDMAKVVQDGYNHLLRLETENLCLKSARSPKYRDASFVFVNITSIWSDFSLKGITSNVPVEVNYSFNIFEWMLFVAIRLGKEVKGKICKLFKGD